MEAHNNNSETIDIKNSKNNEDVMDNTGENKAAEGYMDADDYIDTDDKEEKNYKKHKKKNNKKEKKKTDKNERSENGKYFAGYISGMVTVLLALVIAFIIYEVVVGLGFVKEKNVGDIKIEENKEIDTSIDGISEKIMYLSGLISTYYLEDVETKDIVEGIYKGIFESLNDPYSQYYSADEYKAMINKNNGQFVGIGVVVSKTTDGLIKITSFLEGGTAKESGLCEGDILLKVDGEDITKMSFEEVVDKIQGEEGTKVSITVKREEDGTVNEYEYDVERTLVDSLSVSSKMIEGNIGYIRISGYEANTVSQFKEQLEKLINDGMVGLIIDERANGGGLLTSVTGIADCLMDSGVLVTIKNKNGDVTQEVKTTDDTMLNVPLVLLVDENSASASEVLAGAVKDRNIGKVVGRKTFGKGIVQSIIPLNDGSAVKVTTERYYTPNGNYIHGVGIEPDYDVELDKVQAQNGIDTQYEKAVEVIKTMIE